MIVQGSQLLPRYAVEKSDFGQSRPQTGASANRSLVILLNLLYN
jgi:hypothetical protein